MASYKSEQLEAEKHIREEATAKERARAEKMIRKMEKVKVQEISIAKRDSRKEVDDIRK